MTKKVLVVIACTVMLCSCGTLDHHANDAKGFGQPDFITSQTRATSEQLEEQWSRAQQQIATVGVRLSIYNTAAPVIDPRALNIKPHGVTVIDVPDMPISELVKIDARWATHTDPSGTIMCSNQTAHSCTDVNANTIYVAASLIPDACQYEFDVIIMNALGYDVSQM